MEGGDDLCLPIVWRAFFREVSSFSRRIEVKSEVRKYESTKVQAKYYFGQSILWGGVNLYALILAGASDISGVRKSGYKAGLNIGDGTMLGEAIAAVSSLQDVVEIVVVGDEGLLSPVERAKVGRVLEPKGTLFTNLELGFSVIPEEGKVLVIASDLPLITTEACRDFLEQ